MSRQQEQNATGTLARSCHSGRVAARSRGSALVPSSPMVPLVRAASGSQQDVCERYALGHSVCICKSLPYQ